MRGFSICGAVTIIAVVLLGGCGGNASPTQSPATAAAGSPGSVPVPAASVTPAANALAAPGEYVTTGGTRSGTNAASPTRCNSPRTQFTEAKTGIVVDGDGGSWQVPSPIHEGDPGTDLYNDCTGNGVNSAYAAQVKTVVIDPDGVDVTAYIHADNYFELWVNGTFVCRDPIAFTPFNSSICRFKAKYPMTYAIRGVDWEEHLGVGLEYAQYNVGDGGLVANFSDGTVTDETWKAETFYIAPVDDPACVQLGPRGARDTRGCPVKPACVSGNPLSTCKAVHFKEPTDWTQSSFDDSAWPTATVYTREQFGPKEAYTEVAALIGTAKFIWSRNLNTDNLVLMRKTVAPAPR